MIVPQSEPAAGPLGFIGLGVMGSRMVKRLLDVGYEVTGHARDREKAAPLIQAGMTWAETPRAATEGAAVVYTMVPDATALEAVCEGRAGLLAGLAPDAVWVQMSTVGPSTVRDYAVKADAHGAYLLDAPVSGGPSIVEQGELTILAGGDREVLDRVRPQLLAIASRIIEIGPIGSGAAMKIALNAAGPAQLIAFSESVLLAERAGVDRETAVEVMLSSVLGSPMLRYRGPFILGMPADPWFSVAMMQKDSQLALELGRELELSLPTTAFGNEMLSAARALGLGAEDCMALFDAMAATAAVEPTVKPVRSASERAAHDLSPTAAAKEDDT